MAIKIFNVTQLKGCTIDDYINSLDNNSTDW